jgi:starch synthase
MRVLLASSEVYPYSKTGGLGDMVGALAKALARVGHQVVIVTPLYRGIRERFPETARFDWQMDLPFGGGRISAEVWRHVPASGVEVLFIDKPAFFDRAGIYLENGLIYPDNAERYIFFSKAVAHLARYLPYRPEIVHLHDWQTGLVPAMIRHQALQEGWASPPKTVFTIHNLAYQGDFKAPVFALANLPPEYFSPAGAEYFGSLNCMKAGIAYADIITTVSPRYAREITTEAFGCGLDGFLRQHQARLVGMLNGVDYDEWNTVHNAYLPHPYSVRDLDGKMGNKIALQREMGLPTAPDVPLFGAVSRLADQKGTDLLLGGLEEMLAGNLQFVFLGSGEPVLEKACQHLAKRFPNQVAVRIGFDQPLSHRIEAGCDFFLMPSRFEPCGLNQMYSLRYGTIPIVRRTGGLDDSVVDYTEDARLANGIKFTEYSPRALSRAIRKALAIYHTPALLQQFRKNAMKMDFSWTHAAETFTDLYRRLLKAR